MPSLNRSAKLALIFLAAMIALFVFAKLRYPGRATDLLPASVCDATLRDHVYSKGRLHVLAPCAAVEGRVHHVNIDEDGDAHIALIPDDPAVLNISNALRANGYFVAEVVCDHQPPAPGPARDACRGFQSSVALPKAGEHVRITGSYVTDSHNGWNEIHPISRIEIISRE